MKNFVNAQLSERDYENRITVLSPEEADSFIIESLECNGIEVTEDSKTEMSLALFNGKIPANGIVLYVVPSNGNGKGFIFNADTKYCNITAVVDEAIEYAYEE